MVWNTSSWIPDRPGEAFNYVSNTAGINALWRSGAPATGISTVAVCGAATGGKFTWGTKTAEENGTGLFVNAGTVLASADGVIATNCALTLASGAFFSNSFKQAVGSIAGGGTISQGASGLVSNGLDNTSTTFTGTVSARL